MERLGFLSLGLVGPVPFRSFGLLRESLPGRFRPAATIADMFEGGLFRLDPGLFGPGEEEFEGWSCG